MEAEYRQIISFLKELDSLVTRKYILYLIGGGAITLAYDHKNRTSDLDAINPAQELIKIGGMQSKLAYKYKVGISPLFEITFSAPSDWKSRCKPVDLNLKNISIFVSDVHDLILGKVARLEPRDLEDIVGLHDKKMINVHTLIERLNKNRKELAASTAYRNNAKLLFELVIGHKLIFEKGDAKLSK